MACSTPALLLPAIKGLYPLDVSQKQANNREVHQEKLWFTQKKLTMISYKIGELFNTINLLVNMVHWTIEPRKTSKIHHD